MNVKKRIDQFLNQKKYLKKNFKNKIITGKNFALANFNISNTNYPYYNKKKNLIICLDGYITNLNMLVNRKAANYDEPKKWSKNDHSNTLERLLIIEIWFKLMRKYI